MQSDNGKLFVGGISWDTDEERLKKYFGSFGEVLEAVIMKDRNTGRARGFGFVVFADPSVAERVIKEKHNIDGRMVEAKRAVPRVEQNVLSRNSSASNLGSPGPSRTKKIFVGGLASTVTESDFKKYFEQFGTITDVVVMYDHYTQRPRGFGFITYDSENAVDKVLTQTFHELNGKMVEVKQAVPKELSPGPSFSPFSGFNYSPSRINSLLNGYTQGFVPAAVGAYGFRMNDGFNPIPGDCNGLPPFGLGYGMGNLELAPTPSYGDRANFSNKLSYGRGMSAYYVGDANRFPSSIGYNGGHGGNSSSFSLWGNADLNNNTDSASSNAYRGVGVGSIGGSIQRNSGASWSYAGHAAQGGGNNVGRNSLNVPYGAEEDLHSGGYGRRGGSSVGRTSLYGWSNGSFDGPLTDLYGGEYGDPTWQSLSSEHDVPAAYSYGLGNATSDGAVKKPEYVGGYTVNGQSNRGKIT